MVRALSRYAAAAHSYSHPHAHRHTHAHKLICTNTFVAQIYVKKKFDKTAENVVFLTFAPLTFAIKHFSLIYQQGCGILFCMRRFSFTSDRPLPLLLLCCCCCRCCYCLCLPAGIVCFAMFRLALHTRCDLHIYTRYAFR